MEAEIEEKGGLAVIIKQAMGGDRNARWCAGRVAEVRTLGASVKEVRVAVDARGAWLWEHELVLMIPGKPRDGGSESDSDTDREGVGACHALGVVRGAGAERSTDRKGRDVVVTMAAPGGEAFTPGVALCGVGSEEMAKRLRAVAERCVPGAAWVAVGLGGLAPHVRQVQALERMPAMPRGVVEEILQPRKGARGADGASTPARTQPQPQSQVLSYSQSPSQPHSQPHSQPQSHDVASRITDVLRRALPPAFVSHCDATLTAPQRSAVAALFSPRRIALVMGPPGTGKTRAVGALVGALLLQKRRALGSVLGGGNHQRSDKRGVAITAGSNRGDRRGNEVTAAVGDGRVRVLVCAQSNAAVDEVACRLARDGVVGADGKHRKCRVVRMGKADAVSVEARALLVDVVAGEGEGRGESQEVVRLRGRERELRERLGVLRAERAELEGGVEGVGVGGGEGGEGQREGEGEGEGNERKGAGKGEGEGEGEGGSSSVSARVDRLRALKREQWERTEELHAVKAALQRERREMGGLMWDEGL